MQLDPEATAAQLPPEERLRQAKAWLQENPDEKPVTAARIYSLKPTTLYSSLSRPPNPRNTRGGHNKVLTEHHKDALYRFIRALLANGIQPTPSLVYNAICGLKRAQNPDNFKAPTLRWFSGWWKESNLHKIKTKPLAVIRFTAQQEQEVKTWFRGYQNTLVELKIKRRNICNFDEAGFRVGYAKGQWILVPEDIYEVIPLFNII
jgi:hypothetical protein